MQPLMGGLRPTTEDHRLVPSPVVPVPILLFVLSPLALGTLQWSLSKGLVPCLRALVIAVNSPIGICMIVKTSHPRNCLL